jgi:hypothetical protein
VDSATHTAKFSDFAIVYEAMRLLTCHGYRQLHKSLEPLVPKSFRLVGGRAFGLPRAIFVLVWMDAESSPQAGRKKKPRARQRPRAPG